MTSRDPGHLATLLSIQPFLHPRNLQHPPTLLEIVGNPLNGHGIGVAKVSVQIHSSYAIRENLAKIGKQTIRFHILGRHPNVTPSDAMMPFHTRHREREGAGPRFNLF